MLSIADHFSEAFHAEHREVGDLALALIDAFNGGVLSVAVRPHPHVGDRDGLSLMVKTLPEDDVAHMPAIRDVARETNADVPTWARTMRACRV